MKCDYCKKKIEGEKPITLLCDGEPFAYYHKKCAKSVKTWFDENPGGKDD